MTLVRVTCTDGPIGGDSAEAETLSFGRHKTNDVRLVDDDNASRFHCVIEQHSRGPIVRDLGSRNGTKVNGQRVGRHLLATGDRLRVGRHTFEVELLGEAAGADDGANTSESAGPSTSGGAHRNGSVVNPVANAHEHALFDGLEPELLELPDPAGADPLLAHDDPGETPSPGGPPPAWTEPAEETSPAHNVQAGSARTPSPDLEPGRPEPDAERYRSVTAEHTPDDPTSERSAAADPALPLAPERGRHTGDAADPAPAPSPSPRRAARTDDDPSHAAWADQLRDTIEQLDARHTRGEDVDLFNADGRPSGALDGSGPAAVAVRLLLLLAAKTRATDLHVEPKRDHFTSRVRIDGVMVHVASFPMKVGDAVMGLIKTACQFPEAARDVVLDGHFSAAVAGERVDYRASFTPTVHGRKLVLRVLDPRGAPQSLNELNLPLDVQQRVERLCESDAGMLLAAGPTGSGKTTTLYNCLRFIDRDARNVVTIEDPVEYAIDGTTQIPVSDRQRFGALLRSVLRQDPDVILVGEIRDGETARTAAEAAMTGHIVFTTVHAKDSFSAVFRLLDLGVDNALLANALELVVAQRLVKVLCPHCKRAVAVTPGQSSRIGRFLRGAHEVCVATGCSRCMRTGYRGRRGLYEMLEVNDDMRDCILGKPSLADMKKIVGQSTFRTLQQAGWELAAKGVTSLDEIERVATGSR